MMKRMIALLCLLALAATFAACGNGIKMRQIVEANRGEALLEAYDSVRVSEHENGELLVEYYLSDEWTYEKQPEWEMYMSDASCYGYVDGAWQRMVFLTEKGVAESLADYRAAKYDMITLDEMSLLEKVESVEKTDEHIAVKTYLTETQLKNLLGATTSPTSFTCEYLLDADTRAVITATATAALEEDAYQLTIESEFNCEPPAALAEVLAFEAQTEDLRTVTLVFDAGTRKETSAEILMPKGMSLGLGRALDAEGSFGVYSDAACTEPYQSEDYESDVTVYIKWDK